MAIFIPKNIRVGYRKRSDTFDGKLSYPIYYDNKGKIRKEPSFNSWKDDKIPVDEYENVPMEGFILNKKAGGYNYSWNQRQTYCRVWHPLGFEFEIGIENLLFVLEHCDCLKGKKIQGELTMGWDGKDHLLVPVDSPEYQEIKHSSDILNSGSTIRKGSDLNIGYTYKTKSNDEYTYLGKFKKYDPQGKDKKNHYYFMEQKYKNVEIKKTLGDLLIKVTSKEKPNNFDKWIDKIESMREFSPKGRSELIPIDKDKFIEVVEKYGKESCYVSSHDYKSTFITENGLVVKIGFNSSGEHGRNQWGYCSHQADMTNQGKWYTLECYDECTYGYYESHYTKDNAKQVHYDSLEDLYDSCKPCYRKIYLENGKLNQVEFTTAWTNLKESRT